MRSGRTPACLGGCLPCGFWGRPWEIPAKPFLAWGRPARPMGRIRQRSRLPGKGPLTIAVLLSLTIRQTAGPARVQPTLRPWCAAGAALALALIAAAAPAQERDEERPLLRSTLQPAAAARVSAVADSEAGTAALLQTTPYGNPPGSGAGLRGFISTDVLARKTRGQKSKKTSVAQLAPAAAAPAPLTAPVERVRTLRARPVQRENAIIEPPRPRRTPVEDEPFAPGGVRARTFVLRGTLDVSA